MNKKNVKNGKLSAIIAGVLMFCLFFASPSYAGETLNNTKDEIRSLFNDAASAYPAISEKAKISEENKKLEILRLEISDYLTLAEKLAEQQKYRDATVCYQKILQLCNDPKLKKLIRIENKKLKQLLKQTKKTVSKEIAKKKRSILSGRKPTAADKKRNLEKQHTRRSELLRKLQKKLQKLEKEDDGF
ncbi:MAG: hypothetical protein ISS33_06770 [Candidatus Omnitrophica bacterium]|nr:hypothetical protein [Candidatus Omnitrophota bacterium]